MFGFTYWIIKSFCSRWSQWFVPMRIIYPDSEKVGNQTDLDILDPVTWYGINYADSQAIQWDVENKETSTSPARLSFVLKVPLCNLRPSIIYSLPCEQIMQRTYWSLFNFLPLKGTNCNWHWHLQLNTLKRYREISCCGSLRLNTLLLCS